MDPKYLIAPKISFYKILCDLTFKKKVKSFEPRRSTDEMSSVQKLGVPVLFFFTIAAVHGSLKLSREQGKRELSNSANTSLRASMI